jgi:hypothetical protein
MTGDEAWAVFQLTATNGWRNAAAMLVIPIVGMPELRFEDQRKGDIDETQHL